ncbi:hypothetical protein [Flavobacterium sp.]|uniref:hypothetical protein n=1 Tax=Flavobacterium sp. TaxID=239 RepID=UPI0026397CE6|nr:hypothetical protein [Flavobacterium sp.]
MIENIKPVITKVGLIYGRDAIFLDKVNFINEETFELLGEFSGSLCKNLNDNNDVKFKIVFKNVHLFKMTELDFDEVEYKSSFDEIENSIQINKMVEIDNQNNLKKIDKTYKHYIFRTYDTVFEIIGKDYSLEIN